MKYPCKIAGCPRERRSHGLCITHKHREEKGLPMVPVKRAQPEKKCKVEGCNDRDHYAKNLCRLHYNRKRNGWKDLNVSPYSVKVPCGADNCDRLARVKGLCASHYKQSWYGREIGPLRGRLLLHVDSEGRVCSKCFQYKTNEAFYPRVDGDGYRARCRRCTTAMAAISQYEREPTRQRPGWAYDHMEWADAQDPLASVS